MEEEQKKKRGHRGKGKHFSSIRNSKNEEEILALNKRIEEEAPARGVRKDIMNLNLFKTNPLAYFGKEKKESPNNVGEEMEEEYKINYPEARKFEDLPISQYTKRGLVSFPISFSQFFKDWQTANIKK